MSRLDRWNPLTPLAAALLLVVVAYTTDRPAVAAATLLVALGGAWAMGFGRRVSALTLAIAVPTLLLLVVMNARGPAPGAPVLALGALRLDAAACADALGVALRLGTAMAALGWLAVGVSPRRLTRALAAHGLPAWCAYVLVASLEAVPEARRRAQEVLDAQRCRGLAAGGGLPGRLRALVPLVGPLAVSLVVESEERALALDARGFRPWARRTALAPVSDTRAERWGRAVAWTAIVALLAWRMVRAWRGLP